MSNYKLIHNEEELNRFVELLPELLENEGYFLILVARAKWNEVDGLKSATKLKRETTNSKDKIRNIIKQWEIELGSYISKHSKTGELIQIPNENLGVYISYNPKDQYKGAGNLAKACLDAIINKKIGINIKSMANDIIQDSNGSKNFLDIDVDLKNSESFEDVLNFIHSIIPKESTLVIKTSGGFHCLINMKHMREIENNTWYQAIKNHTFKSDLNIMSNDLMPVSGCNQGKHVPFIVK